MSHPRIRTSQLSLAAEMKLIEDADRSEAVRRERRKAARKAQACARAELQRELETPLIARPAR